MSARTLLEQELFEPVESARVVAQVDARDLQRPVAREFTVVHHSPESEG